MHTLDVATIDPTKVGLAVARLIDARGLSDGAYGAEVGLGTSTVNRMRTGQQLTLGNLAKVLDYEGLSASEFFAVVEGKNGGASADVIRDVAEQVVAVVLNRFGAQLQVVAEERRKVGG